MTGAQALLDLGFVFGAGALCSVPVAILIGTALGLQRLGHALSRTEYADAHPEAWQARRCHRCGGAPLADTGLLVPDDRLRLVRCGACGAALYHFHADDLAAAG